VNDGPSSVSSIRYLRLPISYCGGSHWVSVFNHVDSTPCPVSWARPLSPAVVCSRSYDFRMLLFRSDSHSWCLWIMVPLCVLRVVVHGVGVHAELHRQPHAQQQRTRPSRDDTPQTLRQRVIGVL